MSKFKSTILNFLKGKFLVSEDSFKNWRFMFFIVGLMLVMIASSHNSDKKVMEIASMNKKNKELRAEFLDTRAIAMKMKLESTIKNKVAGLGLSPSTEPPQLIKVTSKKTN